MWQPCVGVKLIWFVRGFIGVKKPHPRHTVIYNP